MNEPLNLSKIKNTKTILSYLGNLKERQTNQTLRDHFDAQTLQSNLH